MIIGNGTPPPTGIYFAYGSNLNLTQMQYRCPTARLLGTGRARGYALCYRGRAPGCAFLTVSRKAGAVTPVAAFAVLPSDVASLDIYEGVASAQYHVQFLSVNIAGQGVLKGFWYVMTGGGKFPPFRQYVETVTQGYQMMGFNLSTLQQALKA